MTNIKSDFKIKEKEASFKDIVGIMSSKEKTNAVELVKELYQ